LLYFGGSASESASMRTPWQSHDAIQHQKRKMHAVPLRPTDVLLLHARTLYGHGLPQHETNAYLVVSSPPHRPTAYSGGRSEEPLASVVRRISAATRISH
jgi:hypothetical protein